MLKWLSHNYEETPIMWEHQYNYSDPLNSYETTSWKYKTIDPSIG